MPTLLNSSALYSVVWFGVSVRSIFDHQMCYLNSFLAVRHFVLSSEASKVTEGLLGFHTSIIAVLTVFGSFLSVKWLLGTRGGMETYLGRRTL